MFARQVIGGCKAVSAAADDHHVIGGFWVRLAPCGPPVAVARNRVLQQRPERIFRHLPSFPAGRSSEPSYRAKRRAKANKAPSAIEAPTLGGAARACGPAVRTLSMHSGGNSGAWQLGEEVCGSGRIGGCRGPFADARGGLAGACPDRRAGRHHRRAGCAEAGHRRPMRTTSRRWSPTSKTTGTTTSAWSTCARSSMASPRRSCRTAVKLRPRLAEVNARLDQIGPPPARRQAARGADGHRRAQGASGREGQDQRRARHRRRRAWVRAYQLIDTYWRSCAATCSRARCPSATTLRSALNAQTSARFPAARSPTSTAGVAFWLRFVVRYELRAMLLATFFALAAVAGLLLGGRRLFGRTDHRRPGASRSRPTSSGFRWRSGRPCCRRRRWRCS